LSVLTNFEELAIYDCRHQPKKDDRANVARLTYVTYQEYEDRWNELAELLSWEAVISGSLDSFVAETKRRRTTIEVDDAFLADIEHWRSELAKDIALRNAELSVRQINTTVQQIIDRIIFLRIAEDRGIEPYGTLAQLEGKRDAYAQLCGLFIRADGRYNSGLFHFKKTRSVAEAVDTVSLKLEIDGNLVSSIVKRLYYPDSPYAFSVIPADILGQVYEQFLGKVINIQGKRATVEEKPEVKKAGGIYYTPTYVVRYLVGSTLSPLLAGKSPAQISGLDKRIRNAHPLRVIDPACGSGSFLIEAYQQLLDWYLGKYVEDGSLKHSRGREPKVYQVGDNEWRLSIAERRRILLTHIYGVDLDSQAVEVTKLSLCLKLLEGETKDEIARQMDLFNQRALPDLHGNIRWGNSLVSTDAYSVMSASAFDDELDLYAINPFEWNTAFPFLSECAFDAIVGNPPYLPIFEMRKDLLQYYQTAYQTYQKRFDAYALFLELAFSRLMGETSRLGMIIPSSLLNNVAFSKTREMISRRGKIEEIRILGGSVFKRVNKDTMTVCARGSGTTSLVLRQYAANVRGFGAEIAAPVAVPQSVVKADGISVRAATDELILSSVASATITAPIGTVASTFQGIVTGADDVFIADYFDVDKSDHGRIKPFLFGSDIAEYVTPSSSGKIAYVTKDAQLGPKLLNHLKPARARLTSRRETKNGRIPWFALHWPRRPTIFEQPKILVQGIRNIQLRRRLVATYDDSGYYAGVNLNIVNLKEDSPVSLHYLLGVINSRVANYWFTSTYVDHRIKNAQLETLPVPVRGGNFLALKPRLEVEVRGLLSIMRKVRQSDGGTSQVWQARADAARERIERLVEQLYELDQAAVQQVREAPCNAPGRKGAS
jgi:hypothetical protein